MRKCLKIRVIGKVQNENYKTFIQKAAHDLSIEGILQNVETSGIMIHACGPSVDLEKFIDALYQGSEKNGIQELNTEPFANDRNFRGVFRIIGD
jgi:acylphosphatase